MYLRQNEYKFRSKTSELVPPATWVLLFAAVSSRTISRSSNHRGEQQSAVSAAGVVHVWCNSVLAMTSHNILRNGVLERLGFGGQIVETQLHVSCLTKTSQRRTIKSLGANLATNVYISLTAGCHNNIHQIVATFFFAFFVIV